MTNNLSGVDWIELLEPQNNQIVYISLSTGVTSEKRPLNVEIRNGYDFEWWELLDTKSNRFYYFNTKTKETTWNRPQSSSIIPFGNVHNTEVELMRPQNKILNYASGPVNKRNSAGSGDNRQRPPDNQSDCISLENSESPVDDLVDKLDHQCRLGSNSEVTNSPSASAANNSTSVDSNSNSNNNNNSNSGGALSSTPSIKHRPFPRTNPRSIPRRSGGAESPITHTGVSGSQGQSVGGGGGGIKTNQGRSRRGGPSNQTHSVSSANTNVLTQDESQQQGMLPLSGSGNQLLLLNQQQRCHSRGSLSSAGTDSTNQNRLINMTHHPADQQHHLMSQQQNLGVNNQGGIGLSQELAVDISSNASNQNTNNIPLSSYHHTNNSSNSNLSNGAASSSNHANSNYPLYDHPPPSSYYLPHPNSNNNQMFSQHQQQFMNRMTSPNAVNQSDTFSLRRPQSEQAIGVGDGNSSSGNSSRQRMPGGMVSPRSDVLPPSNPYPTTNARCFNMGGGAGGPGAWSSHVVGIDPSGTRSLSPPPIPPAGAQYLASPAYQQQLLALQQQQQQQNSIGSYPGPLPGWNSELFRKDQAPAKLLNWSKDNIQKPLLVSTDKILKSEACQAFKQIQSYMGDRKSKHSPTELVTSIIQKGINYYPLRDEIFMQICKQTTNNPDELSTLRGWELLRTCLMYFVPSVMFRPYLEGYILRHLDTSSSSGGGGGGAGAPGEMPTPLSIQQAAEQTLQILFKQLATMVTIQQQQQQQQMMQQQQQQMMYTMQHQQQQAVHQQQQQQLHSQTHLSQSSSSGGGGGGQKSSQLQLYDSSGGTSQFEQDEDGSQRCLPALNSHFGYTLEEIMRGQYLRFPDRELPWVLVTLCEEVLRRGGECCENIFRTSADPSAVQALCTVLDQCCGPVSEHPLTSGDISPHTPAKALLRWLDSLLEPLVPQQLLFSGGGKVRGPMDVYQGVSRLHQVVLMYLVRFLQLLSLDEHVRANRMGPWNLAVVFAPHIFQLETQRSLHNNNTTTTSTSNNSSQNNSTRCQRNQLSSNNNLIGGGSSGLETCRSDDTNASSNNSGGGGNGGNDCNISTTGSTNNSNNNQNTSASNVVGNISNSDDQHRPQINFLYQLILGLDTSPLESVI